MQAALDEIQRVHFSKRQLDNCRRIAILISIGVGFAGTAIFHFASFCLMAITGEQWLFGYNILSALISIALICFYSIVSFIILDYRVFQFLPFIIPRGHLGIVLCHGVPTGQVLVSGRVDLPPFFHRYTGWTIELEEISPIELLIDDISVSTRDGLSIKISGSASVTKIDPIVATKKGFDEAQIKASFISQIRNSFAKVSSLNAVIDIDAVEEASRSKFDGKLADSGYSLGNFDLSIGEMPPAVSDLVRTLDIMKERFPDVSTVQLADIIATHSGNIDKKIIEIAGFEEISRQVSLLLNK
jgi:hypothetical protein